MTLPEIPDDLTPAQIVETLAAYWGVKKDAELGRCIGVERGSIAQYKGRSTSDVQTKMIIALLRDIRYLESKLSSNS